MEIKIDPEFQALIPPLAMEELQQLEANIVQDGCRDPLVVWPLLQLEVEDEDGKMATVFYDDAESRENEFGKFCVWNDFDLTDADWPCILIDGHNRYEICTRLGIQFNTVKKKV